MSKKSFLDSIRVKSPCSQSWKEMRGNDQVRFCEHCVKEVHNLSHFTRKDARRLIAESGGEICVQYVRRPDGRIETLKKQLHQITRQTGIAAGVLGTSLGASNLAYAQAPINTNLQEPETKIVSPINEYAKEEAKTEGGSDSISGTITDPNGAVIPNASVTISNEKTNEIKTTAASDEGFYEFKNIAAGTYNLKIESPYFKTHLLTNIISDGASEIKESVSLELGNQVTTMGFMIAVAYDKPLLQAVSDDNLEEVRMLVAKGENVNARDKNYDGITALFAAVENGNTKIAETLLNFGAKVNIRDNERRTPLMRLDDEASVSIVNLLIKHGAKVKLFDKEQNTVLHHVAEYENAEGLRVLINEGADADAQNKEGETALTISAENGNLENVKTLLTSGANVNLRNKKGENALSLATENEYEEIVEILLAYGAKK